LKKGILVTKLVSAILFAMAVCLAAGCASQRAADGDRPATTGGSGVTVFGTIDAGVSGSRNR
jgi:hypothetical protein